MAISRKQVEMCRQQEMRETQSFLLQIDLCGPQVFFTGHCGFIIIYKKKKLCRLLSYYPADVDSKAAVWLSASERFPVSYCSYYSIQWMCMTMDSNCKLKDAPDLIANVLHLR